MRLLPVVLCLVAGNLACGEEDPIGEEVELALCQKLQSGPGVELRIATSTNSADESSLGANRIDVALSDSQPGYLVFTAAQRGDFVFGLSADVSFKLVRNETGERVLPQEVVAAKTLCPELRIRRLYRLEATRYDLELGPAPTDLSFSFDRLPPPPDGE